MGWLWGKDKKAVEEQPKPARRRTHVPMEVRLFAVKGCEAGLTRGVVAEVSGVTSNTIRNGCRTYRRDGQLGWRSARGPLQPVGSARLSRSGSRRTARRIRSTSAHERRSSAVLVGSAL